MVRERAAVCAMAFNGRLDVLANVGIHHGGGILRQERQHFRNLAAWGNGGPQLKIVMRSSEP